MDSIERALADLTDWVTFERISCRVLNSEGFKVEPRGGSKDEGRDAIEGDEVTFQFSIQENVLKKLSKEHKRYGGTTQRPKEYVFVTNQGVPSKSKDKAVALFGKVGIKLRLFDRAWLSGKIGADKLKDLRDELLASNIITAPDIVRFALRTPLRNSILAALDEGTKDAVNDDRLRMVRGLMKAGEFVAAETHLRQVLEQAALPTSQQFEAHLHLGNVIFQQGKAEEAKAEWRKAIDTGHPNSTAAVNLATMLLILENKTAEAHRLTETGLEGDARSAGLINVMGLVEWTDGNAARALELFRQAQAIEDRPEFLLNEWNLQSESGRPPSNEEIERALERYPTHKDLLLIRANRLIDRFQETHDPSVLQQTGETIARALAVYMPRLEKERKPDSFAPLDHEWIGCALNTQASVAYWSGNHARAEQLIRLAILFNDAPIFQFTLGQALAALGRYEEAIAAYENAGNRGLDKIDLWIQLGNAHYIVFRQTGDPSRVSRAAACYAKAAETHPMAFVNLAQLSWDIGERDKARRLIAKALAADPNEPVTQCNAIVYECNDDPRCILERMPEVEAQHPGHPTVLTVIGNSHYQLGEWEKAFAYLDRGINAAGPNSGLVAQAYPLAADALAKRIGGSHGRLKALEYLLKGSERLPKNAAIEKKLNELSK